MTTHEPALAPTFIDIQAAARRIAHIAQHTPVMTSRSFNAASGVDTFFKCENLQTGGAFKIRGASNFIYSIPEADRAKGVVAFSSGNHAQAVAIAARSLGIQATIAMPTDAPKAKLEATKGYGARVVFYDRLKDDRVAFGKKLAEESGATLVPPYDHPWILSGQGTAAMELLQDTMIDSAPSLDALVVCVGGGGLMSGSSISAKAMHPSIRCFGVEPVDANDTFLSLAAGKRVSIDPPKTIADGLRSQIPGEMTFPILQKNLESVILVSEDEIRETFRFLLTRMKILVEPSGCVSAAAVLFKKLPPGIKRAGVILSGGNVDYEMLASL